MSDHELDDARPFMICKCGDPKCEIDSGAGDAGFVAEMRTLDVLDELHAERRRQDARFGVQDLPDVDPDMRKRSGVPGVFKGLELPSMERSRFLFATAKRDGYLSFSHVALEEFAEVIEQAALGKEDLLRAELVQLGAVAALWIEAIDRRKAKRTA